MMNRQGFLDALECIIPSIHFWGLYAADIITFNGSVQLPEQPTKEDRISYEQFLRANGFIKKDLGLGVWKVMEEGVDLVDWAEGEPEDFPEGWYVGIDPDSTRYPYLIYKHGVTGGIAGIATDEQCYVFNPYSLNSRSIWINQYYWEPDDYVVAYLGTTLKSETSLREQFSQYINWIEDPFEEVKE